MKTNLISIFCITSFILFFSPGQVRADELVRKNINETTTSMTIIRHYDDGRDLVCYHSTCPYFMLYREGVALSQAMYLRDMDTVFDFEIYSDTVYFCGRKINYVSGDAVVGYFDIASFLSSASTNVFYISLPSMESVVAIEVGWFASRKHVVGIGEGYKSKGLMVDMVDETAYWKINFSDLGGDSLVLSDLAITNNHVLTTAIKSTNVSPKFGYVWCIPKSTSPGQSLFPTNATYNRYFGISGSKYLIMSQPGDSYVTAFRGWDSYNSQPFIVSYFYGLTYNRSVVIDDALIGMYQLQAINQEIPTWTVELVMSEAYSNSGITYINSKIMEIRNTNPIPSTIDAHHIDGVYLTSIDRYSSMTIGMGHFVLSGYDALSGFGTPFHVKFQHQSYSGTCLTRWEQSVENRTLEYTEHSIRLNNNLTLQLPEVKLGDKKEMRVDVSCYYHSPSMEIEEEQEQ